MMDFLLKQWRPTPSVEVFYSDMSYGTRRTHKAISKMADKTATVLKQISVCMEELVAGGSKVFKILKRSEKRYSDDEARKLISNYHDGEERLVELLEALIEKEDSAVCDPGLFGNNEDTVIDAYHTCIAKVKNLIKVAQEIRWEIMERVEGGDEAEGEPIEIDDFIVSLR